MKWIGQHIWDFVSRFRNHIYLEDVDTSAIASGKHLGLDANNKIVKSTIAIPPDLTVDGAGTIHPNNLTSTGALAVDITGVASSAVSARGVAGGTDQDVNITAEGEVIVKLDSDGDETAQKFKITNNLDTTVAYIDEGGRFQARDITTGSTLFADNNGVIQVATQGTIDHDSLANFVANEHIDWTGASAGTIHSTNIPEVSNSVTAQRITGPTDTDVQITSDGNVDVTLDNDDDEVSQKLKVKNNASTEVASIDETGNFYLTGNITNLGSDNDLEIQSDGNMTFVIDRDNDETAQVFSFKNFNVEIAKLDESGTLQIDGDLIVSGNNIKDSGNNTIISSDGSGVVTMAGGNISVGGSNANLNMNSGSDIILEADNAGGSNTSSIQYLDSGGTNRFMLSVNNDVVRLCNRASNGKVEIVANTSTAGGSGEVTVVTVEDDGVTMSQLLTAKQRHVMRCGFQGTSTSNMYLPFNYGGTFEATSSSGYLEYGGVVMPADGYVESVIIRSENVCGNSTVGIHVAGTGTEVPSASPGSFASGTINMSADDTAYKFTGFVNQGGTANSFSAGDVVMISFDPTNTSADTTATAVLVLDWNNAL